MIDQGYVIALRTDSGEQRLAKSLGINANTVLVFLDRESADAYLEEQQRENPELNGALCVEPVVVVDSGTHHRSQWNLK